VSAWNDDAACKGKPHEMFFPVGVRGGAGSGMMAPDYGPALAVCGMCPVVEACYAQARADHDIDSRGRAVHGVIAGVAPEEKRIGRPPQPNGRPAARREHGTHAGYQQHRRLKEAACEACKLAHARHNFQRYQQKKAM
jgi:hypothetical protein